MTPCPKPEKRVRERKRIRTRRPLGTVRREAKAAGDVDPLTWEAIVAFYEGRCCHCERAPWREQDHFVPLSRGGSHAPHNVGPSCQRCNTEKGTRTQLPLRPHPWMPSWKGTAA